MTTILFSSSLEGMMSMNWMSIWLMMEVNTMIMCYIMTKESKKEKTKTTTTMKYFLVQMLASSLIMVMVSKQSVTTHTETLMMLCLLMKMGAWPFHLWFMSVVSQMKLNSNTTLLMMTWQKVMPAVSMSMMNMNNLTKMITLALCMLSLVSPMMKVKKFPNNMIMALSSLNNNSWIIMSALVSIKTVVLMLVLYSMTLWPTLNMLGENTKSMEKKNSNMMKSLALFANLSGLPPFTMFWVKVMVVKDSMYKSMNMNILTIMLMVSCAMVSLYLMMMIPYFMKTNNKTQNTMQSKTKNKTTLMLQISAAATMIISMTSSLGFTLQDLLW